MSRAVVLGLLANPTGAEATVNDLTEQELSERAISVVTAQESDARAIIDDGGPLRGTAVETLESKLAALGISSADAGSYARAVQGGQALVAISVSDGTQQAALDTLRSAGAQRVQVVAGGQS